MLAADRLDTSHIEIKQAGKAGFGLTPMTGIRRVSPALDGFHGRQPKVKRKEHPDEKEQRGTKGQKQKNANLRILFRSDAFVSRGMKRWRHRSLLARRSGLIATSVHALSFQGAKRRRFAHTSETHLHTPRPAPPPSIPGRQWYNYNPTTLDALFFCSTNTTTINILAPPATLLIGLGEIEPEA
ncbi:hypothetical protein CPAR01_12504 [Colletotrichum paranaense]|uniref:Uncharacterized protein n=1 Tax=Colletotrichum paranaense TaxID=1914294 RepID=A0ABQ9S6M0_9PEZI|nr:uncharacterized protein CPAR01_12504 [Colletotrichum paranaense]KAK1527946.1 hypothetical protein CPAR01_12504 [Colletotrichum paranaense]